MNPPPPPFDQPVPYEKPPPPSPPSVHQMPPDLPFLPNFSLPNRAKPHKTGNDFLQLFLNLERERKQLECSRGRIRGLRKNKWFAMRFCITAVCIAEFHSCVDQSTKKAILGSHIALLVARHFPSLYRRESLEEGQFFLSKKLHILCIIYR